MTPVYPGVLRQAFAALLVSSLLASCAGAPAGPQEPTPVAIPTAEMSAEELVDLARLSDPATAATLYLTAAWAFAERTEPTAAREVFDAIEPALLARERLGEYDLLAARLALLAGDAARARAATERLSPALLDSPRGLVVQGQLCAAEGDLSCALDRLTRAAEHGAASSDDVWALLNQASDVASLTRPAAASEPEPLAGWRALHGLVISSLSLSDAAAGAEAWLARHPGHPAALDPPAAVQALLDYEPRRAQVALLVPLSGSLARAGEAVRDGFVGAALLAGATESFRLAVYDTAAEPVPALYERALADGASLIVGPLQRDRATSLNALNPDVPVLLLNYLEDDAVAAPGVTQLGLAIEDEALTIARRLDADAVQTALLFHNYEDWSQRARRTLLSSARTELTVQPFADVRTVTEAVGQAMHVADSQERRDELAATLGIDLEFIPRARADVDAVVALVGNVEANALVPALKFHFAAGLPVYASSQVTRRARTGGLTELDGFHVSELPWFVSGDAIYTEMRGAFALDDNPFASLVALGADAFRVSDRWRLPELRTGMRISGSTGLLALGTDGRFSRELSWARIRGGRIVPDRSDQR